MSFIQNLYTSRDNNANAATYVGQQDRLWWNPDVNAIYVNTANTPGGTPVGLAAGANATFDVVTANVINAGAEIVNGNIVVAVSAELGNLIVADQTITGNVAGRDINIDTTGNAAVNILGQFHVHSANLELPPFFAVDSTGQVNILVPTPAFSGALSLIGNDQGTEVAPQNQGVMMHLTGQQGLPSRIYNDGAATYAAFVGRRYNGTAAAPTSVLNNQLMARYGSTPYLSTDAWPALTTTRIDMMTTEDQTSTGQGSKMQFFTVANGETTPTVTLELDIDTGIKMHGNIIPSDNSTWELGNATNKWANLYLGPDSLFMEDTVLGTNAQITVTNGALVINGTSLVQVGNMQMTTTGISYLDADSGANLIVGAGTNTGYMEVDMVGIKFRDDSLQTTAGIPNSYLGTANGVATLDGSGKVPTSQLPAGAVVYKGSWNAATNTPTLANGVGSAGDEYSVSDAGTVNFGAGPITFAAGDFVIYSGTVWQKIPTAIGVASFNTRTGAVTLTSGDVTNALSAGSIVNSKLANPSWTLATGQGIGLTGSGTVALGNSITLTNTGVTAAIAGTGVAVSAATGNVTFSIGQAVGTANSVQFSAVSSTTTIQATGNITGGNLNTGGQIVATGNIRGGNLITGSGTVVNNGLDTTGNIRGGNLAITGAGTFSTTLSATGNISTTASIVGNLVGLVTNPVRNAGAIVGAGTVTLNFTTDSIVKATFDTNGATVAFSNYIPGRKVTLILTNTAGAGRTSNLGVAQINTTNNDITPSVGASRTMIIDYYSFASDVGNVFASVNYG